MKHYKTIALTALISTVAYANQGEERNFGDLLPEDHFQITNSKTTLKDNADISNYEIKSSPKKDEFIYKVNTVKTPRGAIFSKKKDFKLTVERDEGKIERFTSVSFTDNKEGSSVHSVQSTSVQPNGYLNSHTNCYEEYKTGLFGVKRAKSGFKCVTVSAAVCEYLKKSEIDETMVEKINACSDVLGKLAKHQEHLYDLTKSDHKKDVAAISKLNGKIVDTKNFYELEGKTIKDVSEIVLGYGSALSQCESLREKNYLEPKQEPTEENQEGSANSGKEE